MPKGNNILSKKQVVVPAITAALVLMMTPTMAFAQNPHFIGRPNCDVTSSGALECSGRVAGLGNADEVEGFLRADVVAVFGCDNPGPGVHIPPGQDTDTQTVTGDAEILDVRNGQVRFNLDIAAPEPSEDFSCPNPRWNEVLVSAEYTNVELVLGDETLPIPGTFS
jgi:hypothetical protein